jgi:tRNA (guanine26-N2/guanine27-N2)-dimethyltransferase
MAVDRDLGVAVARALLDRRGAPLDAWEMLAATGVRSLRVATESGLFRRLVLTEGNPDALEVLRTNAAALQGLEVTVRLHNARRPIDRPNGFDLVDLDPYGSPMPFLPAMFATVRVPGTIAVTATDLRVLGGADPKACLRRYGAWPVRGRLGPESGLRILLAALSRGAAQRNASLRPLLAYVLGHAVRVYAELLPGLPRAEEVGTLDPLTFEGPALAGERPIGPLWLGPLIDPDLAARLRVPDTAAQPGPLERLLDRFRSEAPASVPFFYEPNEIARQGRLPEPPSTAALIEALRAEGWSATRTHLREGAVRSAAPRRAVLDLARTLRGPARAGPGSERSGDATPTSGRGE